jgi:hypothetical protein
LIARIATYQRFGQGFFSLTLLVIVMSVMSACRKPKEVVRETPVKNRTAGYLLKRYAENKYDFDWLGMKVDAAFGIEDNSDSFKATIRMRKDSVIWVSIVPALGIEMIRVMITPDSLKYLSKIPENKFYYYGAFDDIGKLIGIDFDFEMLQDLLVGNAIALEKDERRFRSEIDNDDYLLISKYRRKVRRVVGVDDRKLEGDTILVNPDDPRYRRTVKRTDEEDGLIISRYWLEPSGFRLVKSVFNDLLRQRTMEITYDDFQPDGEQYYPAKCRLLMSSTQLRQEMRYEITKLSSGKPYEFPFEVPDDYVRRDSL